MRSAQRSQVDSNEIAYESTGPPGLPHDSSIRSNHSEFFGPDAGLASEQALIGMHGHTVDQYGNAPTGSSGYGSRNMDAHTNDSAEANSYGNDPSRLLSVLSEVADNLDYSTNSFMSTPRRSINHAAGYEQPDLRYKAPSSQGQQCQHPGCNKVLANEYDLTYGHQLHSAS